METLQELFEDSVKDVYSAEKQFLKAMPKLAKAAQSESLKEAINTHIEQTKVQIERLEKVGEVGGFKLSGKVCKAAQGLVEEADEHLEEGKPGPVLDAAIVACAQKNEHYEIGTYGTIITWAQELGMKDAVAILKETLAEEEATDKLLSGVAKKEVNKSAAAVVEEEKPKAKK
ncbi:ferritin-like domain-containing protein [bacterium]|nr:MAG: ferritin-like domain-containing protein [bacterium]